MENSKENKKIDFHVGIFKGTKSACNYLCMHSQNFLCIFLEFCICILKNSIYIWILKKKLCMHIYLKKNQN